MPPKKILFLFTELSGYFLACLQSLQEHTIFVVYWPLNNQAPFQFHFDAYPHVNFVERNSFSDNTLLEYCTSLKPDVVVCCGWMDKAYVKVCNNFYPEVPTILTLDNHWKGTLKQHVLSIVSPWYLLKIFSHIWIPGKPQIRYAQKLGFTAQNILIGFYSADVPLFEKSHIHRDKSGAFPQKFIFIGRYVPEKGLQCLWDAFTLFLNESNNPWELYCIGTGPMWDQRINHPSVHHEGFKQPHEINTYLKQGGVFVFPSLEEPWGVALHEMCAAGLPVICSSKVGSASMFVEEGKNGFVFPAGNTGALKELMVRFSNFTSEQLWKMSEESHEISCKITPETWKKTLLSVFK